jgi:uncharacterized membrane protein YwzB
VSKRDQLTGDAQPGQRPTGTGSASAPDAKQAVRLKKFLCKKEAPQLRGFVFLMDLLDREIVPECFLYILACGVKWLGDQVIHNLGVITVHPHQVTLDVRAFNRVDNYKVIPWVEIHLICMTFWAVVETGFNYLLHIG